MREPSAGTGYAQNPLDRRADLRGNAAAIARLKDGRARAVIFAGDRPVLKKIGTLDPFLTFPEAAALPSGADIFLGLRDGTAIFAGTTARADDTLKADAFAVIDLRSLATQGAVPAPDLAILGQAKGLLAWHATHPHCARCGATTILAQAGWRRDCPACAATHFPRTDPVVIMMVVRGERCLLARKPTFPPGMHSCLAGFVEPGETIEDAVRREVLEEAGLTIGRVRYHAAQPWPLPFSQLMIGCFAEALDEEIRLEADELEAGRWFDLGECRAMLGGSHPDGLSCPPRAAIANTLLRAWVNGAGDVIG